MHKLVCIVALCFASCSTVSSSIAKTPSVATERWSGSVALPDGDKLDFSIALSGSGGTIDIPMQGSSGLALSDVSADGATLKFTLEVPGQGETAWARFEATVDADGQTASGVLHQSGMDLPLELAKLKDGEVAAKLERPQEPKAPFPYDQREVTYTNEADGTKLAGTLTLPRGKGKFPAVVLITGSGAQDRDEALDGHKPFLVLADHLTRHGIAVLRVDDRGVGGSTGETKLSTTSDFAGDVLCGVEFLSKQIEIDAQSIGLIGHSEGGVVAPMAAVRSSKVAFIVLMAGTGLPGREIIKLQSELISHADGASQSEAKAEAQAQDEVFELVATGAADEALRAKLRAEIERQLTAQEASDDPAAREEARTVRANLEVQVDGAAKELTSPWFRYFLTLDPRDALRKTKCAVLALNGSKDLQVPPSANLREIEKALSEGGNKDFTTRELPELNHLFQHCTTGSPAEYGNIEETLATSALDLITQWVRQHAHLPVETPATR